MKKKIVTIVGRSNVGKSALFNKLADTKRALVFDTLGVTRDPIHDTSSWKDFQYTIVDTAGFVIDKKVMTKDIVVGLAIEKARKYILDSDVILFMIDGQVGYTQEDRHLFSFIKKLKAQIIIVINKSDRSDIEENVICVTNTFSGYPVIAISAIHSININNLQDMITSFLPQMSNSGDLKMETKVAILGKPNVGKSSIMNILMEKNISIVTPLVGTTRETISELLDTEACQYMISDTAGVRKSRSINERIEELMVSNTINTVQDANIVIMVFDVTEEALSDQDITLMMYSWETLHKAILVVWNKVDLLESGTVEKNIAKKILLYKHIFDVIPQVIFSTIDTSYKKSDILDALIALQKRYTQFLDPKEIKMILKDALYKNPLYKMKQKLDFQKLAVVHAAPPTIVIYSKQKILFGKSELSYLQRCIRGKIDLYGVPIKMSIK